MDNNIRKLASIQRIDDIKPIENADRIEIAKVEGWQVVVKKGQFKKGDLCVYCEIDSLLPERPEFEFLRSKHFRIKTQKMRGVISQGIVFHFNDLTFDYNGKILPLIESFDNTYGIICGEDYIGMDVTELLGIKKYEPPIAPQLMGVAKGNFPTYVCPKSDEQRLQSAMSLLDEMKDKICYITIKEEGTSFTAYHTVISDKTPEIMDQIQYVGVCSRNLELKNEAFQNSDVNIYWKIAKQYDIENKLKEFFRHTGRNIAIQGEITGDGINKNRMNLPRNTHQLHLFNIYDVDNQKYLDYEEFILIASMIGIPVVETIYFGKFNFNLEQLLEMAKGKYPNTNNNREGIVVRPIEETFSETLRGRLSFKVINNEYLLKEEE